MSLEALGWVIENSTTRGSTFTVLLMIANHQSDHDGHVCAWPSVDRLAKSARVTARTVVSAVQTAEAAGELLVARQAGPSGVNVYHVAAGQEGCKYCTPEIDERGFHPELKGTGVRGSVVDLASGDSDVEPKAPKASTRPTDRQVYLAERITDAWGSRRGTLTIPSLQRLNSRYGIEPVVSALGLLKEFPPGEAVKSAYAYVEAICQQGVIA